MRDSNKKFNYGLIFKNIKQILTSENSVHSHKVKSMLKSPKKRMLRRTHNNKIFCLPYSYHWRFLKNDQWISLEHFIMLLECLIANMQYIHIVTHRKSGDDQKTPFCCDKILFTFLDRRFILCLTRIFDVSSKKNWTFFHLFNNNLFSVGIGLIAFTGAKKWNPTKIQFFNQFDIVPMARK